MEEKENRKPTDVGRVFRVRDFVYVENGPTQPYRIGQIQSFKPGVSSGVYARIRFYERARNIDPLHMRKLNSIAEKFMYTSDFHLRNYAPEDDSNTRSSRWHQFKLREVIGNRNCPIEGEECFINANLIRGKCSVFRYINVETISDYLDCADTFFYLAAYEDNPRKLSLEGEIVMSKSERLTRIADLSLLEHDPDDAPDDPRDDPNPDPYKNDVLVWDYLKSDVSDADFDKYLTIVRSIGIFGRAFDHSRRIIDSSIQSTLAYTFRDSTKYMAHYLLNICDYSIEKAINKLQIEFSPLVCTDQLELWSEDDILYFYDEIKKVKRFSDIRRKNYHWKNVKEMVEFYYMNKVTELYMNLKKDRTDKKLTVVNQIRIPTEDLSINFAYSLNKTPENAVCEGCNTLFSTRWFSWIPNKSLLLCQDCWIHWKKYAGLKTKHDQDGIRLFENTMMCDVCAIPFVNKRRFNRHMSSHYAFSCGFAGCGRKFSSPEIVSAHSLHIHKLVPLVPVCTTSHNVFFFRASARWKQVSKQLCSYAVNIRALARKRGYSYDRCIAAFEGRVPKSLVQENAFKRLSDIFANARKRSAALSDVPPCKIIPNV